MTLILDLINGIHKFLGYLDISPKYLNRAYTILSITVSYTHLTLPTTPYV